MLAGKFALFTKFPVLTGSQLYTKAFKVTPCGFTMVTLFCMMLAVAGNSFPSAVWKENPAKEAVLLVFIPVA